MRESRVRASSRPSTIASKRWRSTLCVEALVVDLPDGDAVVPLEPRAGRAHRGSLQREHGGAVGEEPDAVAGDDGDARAAVGLVDLDADAALADRTRDLHVLRHGGRRRGCGRRRIRREGRERAAPHLEDEPRPPARPRLRGRGPGVRLGERDQLGDRFRGGKPRGDAQEGGGIVRVARRRGLGEQQVPPDEQGDELGPLVIEAHPCRDRTGDRLAGHAVLGEPSLADVVQQGRDHEDVGPSYRTDQRGGLATGLHHVSVDGEAVDRRGVRQQPDPLPLRKHETEGSGLLQRLPHGQQPWSGRQQPHEQLPRLVRPRLRQGRGLPHQPGGRRRCQDDVTLGRLGSGTQEEHRVLVGTRPGIEDHLARGERDAGGDGDQPRAATAGRRRRPCAVGVDAAPGQAREVG